jgi:Integrase zinc binding domain
MISSYYVWPNLASDVTTWCKDCTDCQRAKETKQPAAAVQPIPMPAVRFSHVHVDIVGPLLASTEGYAYFLTAVDRSTRWAEAYPLKTVAAADLLHVCICC